MADPKNSRLYREIMHEAVLLGDKFLVDMVLKRLAGLTHPPRVSGTRSNVIAFPNDHLSTIPGFRKPQRVWVTALLTAMIPFGISLLLMAFHYLAILLPGLCPT
jgi:hypothetical protein